MIQDKTSGTVYVQCYHCSWCYTAHCDLVDLLVSGFMVHSVGDEKQTDETA